MSVGEFVIYFVLGLIAGYLLAWLLNREGR